MLDEKIECTECHRVFFVKSTAGKRVAAPDHTKTYIGFGVAAVAIIGLFALSGGQSEPPKKPPAPVVEVAPYGLGDHPRAHSLGKWAEALASNNQLMLSRHTDLTAMALFLSKPVTATATSDDSPPSNLAREAIIADTAPATVMQALLNHESTDLLRTMESSAWLDADGDMTEPSGTGKIYVTPKPGDDRFKRNTRGTFEVTFNADGDTVKVSSFKLIQKPIFNAGKDPSMRTFVGNKDIAKPEAVEITDSAGTRKVAESKPTALPHWDKATPEQRTLADEIVTGILAAAAPDAPGALFNRATLKIRGEDNKKAAVPRVLNAMFECYDDVIGNHQKLILLYRALYQWTGYAVNYPSAPTGNTEADKKRRQSCIRQWFAHWYRYHDNLDAFFDSSENLEDEEDDGGK